MRTLLLMLLALGTIAAPRTSSADAYVEYYRDDLFMGIAYHRVGCLTNWNVIQSDRDYDGFTNTRYCRAGADASSVPGARWFAYRRLGASFTAARAKLDACGASTNARYGTPGYSARSETCNYDITQDCNSDCWMRAFSTCVGAAVPIMSPCMGSGGE
jgi:hypothetical protein